MGGEEFSFEGDDDMWVFVNRHLAIDLGGLHVSMAASVSLDDVASEFGLAIGGTYPIHFFFAERHTIDSNFTIRTTVAEAGPHPGEIDANSTCPTNTTISRVTITTIAPARASASVTRTRRRPWARSSSG